MIKRWSVTRRVYLDGLMIDGHRLHLRLESLRLGNQAVNPLTEHPTVEQAELGVEVLQSLLQIRCCIGRSV
jgi:hypothetical protein